MLSHFFQGIIVGFAISAPIGPVSLVCIRRTLSQGVYAGLSSGFGSAIADALFGIVAGVGVTFLLDIIISFRFWLTAIGSIFLIFLGIQIFTKPPVLHDGNTAGKGFVHNFVSTLLLTLTNPLTLLSFMGIFAALAETTFTYTSTALLVSGIFVGSMLWWFLLIGILILVKSRISVSTLAYLNKVAGIIIIGFGIYALLTVSALSIFNHLKG